MLEKHHQWKEEERKTELEHVTISLTTEIATESFNLAVPLPSCNKKEDFSHATTGRDDHKLKPIQKAVTKDSISYRAFKTADKLPVNFSAPTATVQVTPRVSSPPSNQYLAFAATVIRDAPVDILARV